MMLMLKTFPRTRMNTNKSFVSGESPARGV